MLMGYDPKQRREQLKEILTANPFLPDRRLARHFDVSVQTIRLDRLALGIPGQRTRTKQVAERAYQRLRAMGEREVVGELIDLELGKSAISIMEITPDMAFERTGITRSQYIFAQADSLAICVIDADNVVTGIANLKFKRQARVGEKLIAKAQVIREKGQKSVVLVETRARGELVFRGKFLVFALDERGSQD
ncbi:MAG: transcription factor FapR [Bacillota bacterium]|jgi:acyl-coenzyme A thioesterase PaaI-like protein|nr:transcription factor FapR [Candidatus Fermentithermobacillaceae bacterium]